MSAPSSPVAVAIEQLGKFYPRAPGTGSPGLSRLRALGRRVASDTEADADDELEEDEEEVEPLEEVPATHESGDVWALRDLDLVIERGSALGVIGENGAGKTTLLRILARAIPPTTGDVNLYGRVAPSLALASLFIQPDLTGRDNVRALARFFEIPPEVVDRRIGSVREFAELGHQFDLKVKTYSSGMAARLAFSTMVNLEPEIMLADQVVAVGDGGFQRHCKARLQEAVAADGATLVLASHDMNLVRELCSSVAWLHEGKLRERGSPSDVCERYEHYVEGGAEATRAAKGSSSARPRDKLSGVAGYAAVEGVGLYSSGGEQVASVRTEDSALLEMGLRIGTMGAAVRAVFVLSRDAGDPVRVVQPQAFEASAAGRHTVTVLLPAGLLPEGAYNVRAGVQVELDGDAGSVVRANALSFDVYDPEPEDVGTDSEEIEAVDGSEAADTPEPDTLSLAWEVIRPSG